MDSSVTRLTREESLMDEGPLADVILRARDMAKAWPARHAEAERARMIPAATIDDMKRSGLLRVLQPRRYGGDELDYPTYCRIIEELAFVCSSSAWVYAVYTEHTWIAACFDAQAQEDIWGKDPATLLCSVLAPRARAQVVDGGFRLNGTWPFSSGCDYAGWALLGAMAEGEDGKLRHRLMLVPMSEVEIIDDWEVFGLRATGSKTLKLKDVFVPAYRSVAFADLVAGNTPGCKVHPDYYLIRAPRELFSTYTLAGISLALAQRAYDLVSASLKGKVSRNVRISELETTQIKVAEAASDIALARLRLRAGCRHFHDLLRSGGAVSEEARLANRRDIMTIMRRMKQAVELLCNAAGAQWVYDRDELQGLLRDITTASAHRSANWDSAMIAYGRHVFGLPQE